MKILTSNSNFDLSSEFLTSFSQTAQTITNNPLNGKSKQSARNYIYKLVGDMTKGIFRDDAWQNVSAIWNKMDENNIENNITKADYFKDEQGQPMGKTWKFEVPFTNQKGRQDVLYGTLNAHFSGSVQDPSERYDISFII